MGRTVFFCPDQAMHKCISECQEHKNTGTKGSRLIIRNSDHWRKAKGERKKPEAVLLESPTPLKAESRKSKE